MARWFRFYDDTLNDPKAQRLDGPLFKTWVNLLCIASKHDGILPDAETLAFLARRHPSDMEQDLAELSRAGLLDQTGNGLSPHNWNARQFKSDVSDERVKRHRERQRNVTLTVTPAVTEAVTVTAVRKETPENRNAVVTPSESETETDTEAEKKRGDGACAPTPPPDLPDISLPATLDRNCQTAMARWNAVAEEIGLPVAQRLTPARHKALRARLAECGGLDGWETALSRLRSSRFLRGENEKGWRADFDFILQAKSFTKLMEGAYDDGNRRAPQRAGGSHEAFSQAADDVMRELRERGAA